MKMILCCISIGLTGVWIFAPVDAELFQERQEAATLIVGTWKLVSYEARNQAGEVSYPMGPNATGFLMYDAGGHMMVQTIRAGRSNFKSSDRFQGTPEEAKAAFEGFFAYYGTYRIDATRGAITHRIEGSSFPNWASTEQERFLTVTRDRLELRTGPTPLHGQVVVGTLIWQRVD
jgi:hypothetical protein